jgi:hypothetical protein
MYYKNNFSIEAPNLLPHFLKMEMGAIQEMRTNIPLGFDTLCLLITVINKIRCRDVPTPPQRT